MPTHAMSEAESVECSFEMSRLVDQKRDVVHVLFVTSVNQNLIRFDIDVGLYVCLLNPVVGHGRNPIEAKISSCYFVFRIDNSARRN